MDPERRKALAKSLANNPLLTELLDEIKSAAIRQWESTIDQQGHVAQWHKVRAVNELSAAIKNTLREYDK